MRELLAFRKLHPRIPKGGAFVVVVNLSSRTHPHLSWMV